VDNIPTAGNQEDHVSFGTIAARKARDIARNLEQVLAIECLCAAQGLDFVGPQLCGKGTRRAHEILRTRVAFLGGDRARVFSDDIAEVASLLRDGQLLDGVEQAVGRLD
jgi:histidine ammonia-lyase